MVQGRYEKRTGERHREGNLSPLLSNIMLNELDKELEKRGLRFVRYADTGDSSQKRSKRQTCHVLITDWIHRKLGLKVNAEKTRSQEHCRLNISDLDSIRTPKQRMEVQATQGFGGEIQRH